MFSDRDYTHETLIKQLGLVELHSKDGSAEEAGCKCIETKHLFLVEGLSEEGEGFSLSTKEKQFFSWLGTMSRTVRKQLEEGDFRIPTAQKHPSRLHKLPVCELHVQKCVDKGISEEVCRQKYHC